MHRAFTRNLKAANITTDDGMLSYVKQYTETDRKSGIRALQDFVCFIVKSIKPQTLKELYGVLNVAVPKVAGDALTQNVYTEIRRAVLFRFGSNDELYEKSKTLMKFDLTKWRDAKTKYMKAVADANRNPKAYSFATIKAVLKKTKEGDFIDRLIFLQLASGSRIGELLYHSTYEETKTPHYIQQNKILKTKEDRNIIKPVLFISTDEFVEMFDLLRAELVKKGIIDAATAHALNNTLNIRIKKRFDDVDISTHEARKLYGDMCFNVYKNEHEKDTAFISQVLGHSEDSVQVSTSYLTVSVVLTDADKADIRKMNFNDVDNAPLEIPRNTTARDGKGYERILITAAALKKNNIKITARLLSSYGFGARLINQYMTEQAPIEQV